MVVVGRRVVVGVREVVGGLVVMRVVARVVGLGVVVSLVVVMGAGLVEAEVGDGVAAVEEDEAAAVDCGVEEDGAGLMGSEVLACSWRRAWWLARGTGGSWATRRPARGTWPRPKSLIRFPWCSGLSAAVHESFWRLMLSTPATISFQFTICIRTALRYEPFYKSDLCMTPRAGLCALGRMAQGRST